MPGTTDDTTDPTSGGSTTGEPQGCNDDGGNVVEFSYIWIANSSDGTISKIDTTTGTELGRYITRPDGNGNPSRTSVNRFGDVAVANRSGGITKVFADPEDCLESNGIPGIQTSTGPDDVLPWGEEECVAWYTEIAHNNNRPVAWTNGTLNKETCEYEGVDVFTAYFDSGVAGTIEIAKLDGSLGTIIETIPMPDTPLKSHGFYGAAIDGNDNAWFSQLQGGQLVRVNTDMTVDTWDVEGTHNGYGITVTQDGYVWICGRDTHRFDPVTETWETAQAVAPDAYVHTGGCMGDGNGLLYRAAHANVLGIDTETLDTVVTLPAGQPGDDHIWGVAVDFDGFVWAIPRNAEHAYKMDPNVPADPIVLTVEGLQDCYTYSDMTGFSLFSVVPG
jgi:streptogramin lyase